MGRRGSEGAVNIIITILGAVCMIAAMIYVHGPLYGVMPVYIHGEAGNDNTAAGDNDAGTGESSFALNEDTGLTDHADPARPEDTGSGESHERKAAGTNVEGDVNDKNIAPVKQDTENVEPTEAIPSTDSLAEEIKPEALIMKGTALDLTALKGVPPAYYNSDDHKGNDYVTNVRNQGYTRLCWDYAALAAVESDLLISNPHLDADQLDLSEKHLAYYNCHRASGSKGGLIDDDYRELVWTEDDDDWSMEYGTGYLMVAGVPDYCTSLLMSWKGPVEDVENDSFRSVFGRDAVYKDNTELPSGAYENTFCHVMGVLEVPAVSENRDAVKHLIMEHGAVTASINSADKYWTKNFRSLYDYDPYEGDNRVDHEVVVIGWDDDYPTTEFAVEPEIPGAWICRNSWGEGQGKKGYFYISYEDTVTNSNNMVAYDTAMPGDADWYDYNYQTDGFITHINDVLVDRLNVVYTIPEWKGTYGVLYTADSRQMLEAVALFSMNMNARYDISVYLCGKELLSADTVEIKELGEPVLSQSVSAEYAGYRTFLLEDGVPLDEGDNFMILVTPAQKEDLVFEKAMDYTAGHNVDDWLRGLGSVHTNNSTSGRCFLEAADSTLVRQTERDLCIKAYTNVR